MATTSSKALPATAAAVVGSGTATTTSETIIGSHMFSIDNFPATKDLGVGKCIKSSVFRVGGYGWYIECYPCGDDEDFVGWVTLYLCRQEDHLGSRVSGDCEFTLMESLKDGCFRNLIEGAAEFFSFAVEDGHSSQAMYFRDREELESLLMDDCFHVRCTLGIERSAAVPQPDLATETVTGWSHVLTVENYSKTRGVYAVGESIGSRFFRTGGHTWCISFYPCGERKKDGDIFMLYLCLNRPAGKDKVKVRLEMTLLTHAGQIISSIQDFCTFSAKNREYVCKFLPRMGHESSPLLQDDIQIRCDMAVVEGITAMPNLQGIQHGRGDVTFEVGGHLFSAHKCVLANRCTAFMAEFSGPAGNENAGVTQVLRIDNMEPRVFKALLHFIYTDALPEVSEEDKVGMAQRLLAAADRYAMERLKLICGDILCNFMNDACTAVDTLELAIKHGCHKLREVCKKFLMDNFTKVAP